MTSNASRQGSIKSYNKSFLNSNIAKNNSQSNLVKSMTEKNVNNMHSQAQINQNKANYEHEQLNYDPNPIIIKKKPAQKLQYTQTFAIKYLKPPSLPKPGDLIIRQEPDRYATPLSPIYIRQQPAKLKTPEPIVFREKPPKTPEKIPEKVITIPGKVIPAKRQIIVEKYAGEPSKPPMIIIERWLPYPAQKRRVVLEKQPVAQEGQENNKSCYNCLNCSHNG